MASADIFNAISETSLSAAKTAGRRSVVRDSRISKLSVLNDALAVAIGWFLAGGLQLYCSSRSAYWSAAFHRSSSLPLLLFLFCGSVIFLVGLNYRLHLYSPPRSSILHELRRSFQACVACGLLLSGSMYFIHDTGIPRSTFLVTMSMVALVVCLRRLGARMLLHRQIARGVGLKNVLIVGTGLEAMAMKSHLENLHQLGYKFRGFAEYPGCGSASRTAQGIPFLDIDSIFEYARTEFVDEVFVAAPRVPGLLRELLDRARMHHIDLRVIPEMHDGLVWSQPVEYIGALPTFPLHTREIPQTSLLLKRMMDVTVSAIGLAVLGIPMLVIALMIKLDSPGPILYRSLRVGRRGRKFNCTKFRTMVVDAEARRAGLMHLNERDSVLFKITNDPRVTKLGRILRKYSIDELPQLFDVLRGDMSLVGPRPPIASEVGQYEPNHLRRLDVMPGITGLWQVQARCDPSFDSYISLDLMYVENWTLWLDLKILVRTLGVVLAGTGS